MTNEQYFILALFAAVLPVTVLAVTALLKIRQLHVLVNSRLTELLALTAKSSKAEGVKEGKAHNDNP
jgi:hypothetical protein